MVFLATVDPSPRPQPMKFPVFSADSGGSRPRIRDDVAHHSDLISLGLSR
jgi:hypothetical protein